MTGDGAADGPGQSDDHDTGRPDGRDASADVTPADLDRVFGLLEAAVGEESVLDGPAVDGLLSVLETAFVPPTSVSAGEPEQLLSVLEHTVVEPDPDEDPADVLAVLEAALLETAGAGPEREGVLSVFEAALVDPTDPTDGLGDLFAAGDAVLSQVTDADDVDGGLGSLLDATGLTDASEERATRSDALAGDGTSADVDAATGSPAEWAGGGSQSAGADPLRLARLVATLVRRTSDYSVRGGVRVGTELVRAASTAESPAAFLSRAQTVADEELARAGLADGDRDQGSLGADSAGGTDRSTSVDDLRSRGARLLDLSADVDHSETVHPAYATVLSDLAADEARILRLLATEGPQPSVDVRDVGWVPITTDLVAAGLTMVASEAGLEAPDRTPAYLNNLHRLGLVWFSDEPVDDVKRYQVLAAQPPVTEAVESATRASVDRRSLHLTPFGVDFCRVCFPFPVDADRPAGVYEPPARWPGDRSRDDDDRTST
jgi:hypothetical protein